MAGETAVTKMEEEEEMVVEKKKKKMEVVEIRH